MHAPSVHIHQLCSATCLSTTTSGQACKVVAIAFQRNLQNHAQTIKSGPKSVYCQQDTQSRVIGATSLDKSPPPPGYRIHSGAAESQGYRLECLAAVRPLALSWKTNTVLPKPVTYAPASKVRSSLKPRRLHRYDGKSSGLICKDSNG